MQLYPKKTADFQMQPTQETIQFLMNFSKSFAFVKTKSEDHIELNLN